MSGDPVWFKSSYSGNEGGDCVEVAEAAESVLVRDSKDKSGPQLAFSPAAWLSFVEFARSV
ncbi:DUF397 domain-containing protein [Kitasatospora purpeofusca]|uniref:DUF397 domain-containing protein n=1 Tax=Kitasatospora purpeofusca TaxID=67352 RepID=UPI0036D38464